MKFFVAIFFVFSIFGCIKSVKYHDWYLVPPQNNSQNLYGVGEGLDPEEAKQIALQDAASRLKINISSKFESSYQVDDMGKSSYIGQKINTSIDKITLNDYTILKSEKLTNGDNFITMVAIDTQKLIHSYKNNINSRFEIASKLSKLGNGIMQKRNNIDKAVQELMSIESDIRILGIIDTSYNVPAAISVINMYKSLLAKANASISFNISCDDKDIQSVFEYGLNKLNLGASNNETGNNAVKIKISHKINAEKIFEAYIIKLILTVSVIDSSKQIITTTTIEASGSSVMNNDMAKNAALNKIKSDIDQVGLMKFLKIM